MKKLKCSSCGAELKVEENKEYATCNHCGTRYKLNEDLNINIKLDDDIKEVLSEKLELGKMPKTNFVSIIIVLALGIIIFTIIGIFVPFSSSSSNNFNEEKAKQQEESNKNMFNMQFYGSSGTKNAIFLEHTLDDIVESNKTHDRKVSLVYGGTETTDESEIINIKHSLKGTYEVSVNYDDKGYVNKIVVEKIN